MKEKKQHGGCCNFDEKNAWCNRKGISVLADQKACEEFGMLTEAKHEEVQDPGVYEINDFKTAESLAIRIKTTVHNTQRIMLDAAISIGRDLAEAKDLVGHGEWESWLETEVGFSHSTANKYMQISREYGDGPKSELIPNLSYTKALKLLAVPDEDLEDFLQDNDIAGMTVKELEEKVKALSDEKNASEEKIEKLGDDLVAAEEDKLRLTDEVEELRKKLVDLEAAGADSEDGISEEAQMEIEKHKAALEAAEKKASTANDKAEKIQKKLDQMKADQEKAVEDARAAALEEGKLQGKQENDEEVQKYKTEADEAVKARQAAEKQLAASSSKDLMRISFLIEDLQKTFNDAIEILENIEVNDREQAGKLRGGLHAILGQMQERL